MSPAFGDESAERRFERTLTVTGRVTLDVSAKSGAIRIRRGESGSVTIRGVLRAQPSFFGWIGLEDQIQQLTMSPPIEQDGNDIRIGDVRDRWLLRHVLLLAEVTVPSDTRVRALGDSADIRVEGIIGPVDAETDSGEVRIENIESRVTSVSDSGAIRIRLVAGDVDVRTDSGEIEALEIGGTIEASSDSGDIRLWQTAPALVRARSDSGRIRVRLADGGYAIRVCTDNGRIDVPEMKEARSSRGQMSGRVRDGGPTVDIETDSGNIEVTVPDGP